MKKVSADTITDITLKGAMAPVLLPPSTQELIDSIIEKNPGSEQVIRDFLKHKPEGFRFVPVLYSRVSNEQNGRLEEEYTVKARTDFLAYLGKNHADALKRLGICAHGIARMTRGLDPTTQSGKIYDMSIDHIIERSGSGRYGADKECKELDPMRPGIAARYPVNHFNNLILLPEKVHQYKNKLNTLQRIGSMQHGENVWMLMLIPESNALDQGYVCPPQKPDSGFAPEIIELRDERRFSRANFIGRQAAQNLWSMHQDDMMANLVATMISVAERNGKTPAALAAAEEKEEREGRTRPTLRGIFNATIAYDEKNKAHIDSRVRPFVNEARVMLRDSFNKISADVREQPDKNNLHLFLQYYRGKTMNHLRREAEKFPLSETVDFLRECARVDEALTKEPFAGMVAAFAKAANNNRPQNTQPKKDAPKKDQKPAQQKNTPPKSAPKNGGKNSDKKWGKPPVRGSNDNQRQDGQRHDGQRRNGQGSGQSNGHGNGHGNSHGNGQNTKKAGAKRRHRSR